MGNNRPTDHWVCNGTRVNASPKRHPLSVEVGQACPDCGAPWTTSQSSDLEPLPDAPHASPEKGCLYCGAYCQHARGCSDRYAAELRRLLVGARADIRSGDAALVEVRAEIATLKARHAEKMESQPFECGKCSSGGTDHGGTGDCPKVLRGPCDRFTPMPVEPAPQSPDPWEVRCESVAKYHEEHARHGGASQEFHERALTVLHEAAARAADQATIAGLMEARRRDNVYHTETIATQATEIERLKEELRRLTMCATCGEVACDHPSPFETAQATIAERDAEIERLEAENETNNSAATVYEADIKQLRADLTAAQKTIAERDAEIERLEGLLVRGSEQRAASTDTASAAIAAKEEAEAILRSEEITQGTCPGCDMDKPLRTYGAGTLCLDCLTDLAQERDHLNAETIEAVEDKEKAEATLTTERDERMKSSESFSAAIAKCDAEIDAERERADDAEAKLRAANVECRVLVTEKGHAMTALADERTAREHVEQRCADLIRERDEARAVASGQVSLNLELEERVRVLEEGLGKVRGSLYEVTGEAERFSDHSECASIEAENMLHAAIADARKVLEQTATPPDDPPAEEMKRCTVCKTIVLDPELASTEPERCIDCRDEPAESAEEKDDE